MDSKIQTDGLFLFCLAVSVVILPLKWLLAWLLAAVFHELCHLLVLKLFHCQILSIYLGVGGARIDTEQMKPTAEFICAIAGPLGSFSLLLLIRCLPAVAICGCIQGLYNLLPLNSMDGGRVIRLILNCILSEKWANRLSESVRWIVSLLLLFAGVYIYKSTFVLVPLLFAVSLIFKDRKKTLQKLSRAGTIVLPE